MEPRIVVVSRPDEMTSLTRSYGTASNAAFYLNTRGAGASLAGAKASTQTYISAIDQVTAGIPSGWRQARCARDLLDRFNFEPDDIIAVVGQDGLVANVAKYLNGQVVVGFNDNPDRNPGVLVRNHPSKAAELLNKAYHQPIHAQSLTMVRATLDDGMTLESLNEIYVGHSSHQSARYRISVPNRGEQEYQSSSGVLISTGTGGTGWCSSLAHQAKIDIARLKPTEDILLFCVREPWRSPMFGDTLRYGWLERDETVVIQSNMEDGGVVFGDGIEVDHLPFSWGRVATIGIAEHKLKLI